MFALWREGCTELSLREGVRELTQFEGGSA